MGVMDLVRKMGERKKITKEKFKEAQENMKIEKMLEDRSKSSNERELESYMKKEREKKIKEELDIIHRKQNHENWKGTNMLKQKSILTNDRPILKEKNIFKKQKNMFLDNKINNPFIGGGFFK